MLAKLGDKVIVIVVSKTGIKNAEGGIRTPTGCPIRPSSARVYQFHHFGFIKTLKYIINHEGHEEKNELKCKVI